MILQQRPCGQTERGSRAVAGGDSRPGVDGLAADMGGRCQDVPVGAQLPVELGDQFGHLVHVGPDNRVHDLCEEGQELVVVAAHQVEPGVVEDPVVLPVVRVEHPVLVDVGERTGEPAVVGGQVGGVRPDPYDELILVEAPGPHHLLHRQVVGDVSAGQVGDGVLLAHAVLIVPPAAGMYRTVPGRRGRVRAGQTTAASASACRPASVSPSQLLLRSFGRLVPTAELGHATCTSRSPSSGKTSLSTRLWSELDGTIQMLPEPAANLSDEPQTTTWMSR